MTPDEQQKLRSILGGQAAMREANARMMDNSNLLAICGADMGLIERTAQDCWDDAYLMLTDAAIAPLIEQIEGLR